MKKINLVEKFSLFDSHWDPKIVDEFLIVPRGVEHCPRANEEVQVMLFEPRRTINTGHAMSEKTVLNPDLI